LKINFKKANSDKLISLSKYGILRTYLVIPFRLKSIPSLYSFLGTVIKNFFFLQFSVKWKWRKIQIVNVDNPLDQKVPFTPQKISIYLDFVNFWIRPMTFLMCRVGEKKALPYCVTYLKHIKQAYYEASRIYRNCMSTTKRPNLKKIKGFSTLRLLDPHLMCVPSLHVAICTLSFSFYKNTFKELGLSQEEQEYYNRELYLSATAITETVLFVKQHSVNCIPAAVYMMNNLIPQYFSLFDGTNFVNSIFTGLSDSEESPYYDENSKITNLISEENCNKIREHMFFMYERFMLEGKIEENWKVPILHWLKNIQQ